VSSVDLNIPQTQFLAMPQKFRAFVAGFGSGKTVVGCAAQTIHFAQHPKVNQGYFAPTYPLIRDIFYPTADEVAHWFGFHTKARTGDKEVDFYYGRKYYGTTICRTMDNPANIVGFKIGRAMVDELDVLKTEKAEQSWNKIIARLRWADVQNGIDVTTTPEGFKFTYDRFVKKGGAKYGYIQASTYDNEANLPADYIDSLLDTYPAQLISAYLNGEFVNLTSGTVYCSYNRQKHRSTETIQAGERLYIGMDFNVTRMAASVYVIRNGKEWHLVDEIVDGYDTPAMVETLQSKYDGHQMTVYPDASGKNRKSVGAATSDIAIIEAAGFEVRAKNANPLVKDRVNAVNAAFEHGLLFVNDHKAPTAADNLEQQVYDKSGAPDKTEGKDHQNDATGYPIAYELPIIKPVANIPMTFAM
jgi:hypothetical protein